MLKRGIMVLALVATVALPFVLRPHRASPGEADDTLIVITPHNEAIRHEFTLGFQDWYKARTGRTVFVDWRMIGGTSEIARYLEGEYVASFRNLWEGRMRRPWSAEVQSAFQNGRLSGGRPGARKGGAGGVPRVGRGLRDRPVLRGRTLRLCPAGARRQPGRLAACRVGIPTGSPTRSFPAPTAGRSTTTAGAFGTAPCSARTASSSTATP